MAQPRWKTPAGNLGVVPELEFYDYVLEVIDPTGGILKYAHISGKLPLGIQVIESGRIQGVPVSEAGGDQNVEYTFTIRVKNEIDFVGSISGYTLTVTSVGTGALEVGQQLERFGLLPNTSIVGLLSGTGGAGTYRLNQPQSMGSGNFIATSGVSDRTFRLTITNVSPPIIEYPERNSALGIYLDGTEVDIVLEAIEFTPGINLLWELVDGELPPGLSLSSNGVISGFIFPIPSQDSGTEPGWDATAWNLRPWEFGILAVSKNFSFTIRVTDGLKYDQSTYTVLVLPRSALTTDSDILTVDTETVGEDIILTIDAGTKHAPVITTKQSDFVPARQGTQYSFNLEAIDVDNDIVWWTFSTSSTGAFDEQTLLGADYNYVLGRLVGGRLQRGIFPKAIDIIPDPEVAESISNSDPTNVNLLPGDEVKVLNSSNIFEIGQVNDITTVRLTGNIIPNITTGDYITQQSSGANATVISVSNTTGNIRLGGEFLFGNISVELPTYQLVASGNVLANVGQYITQTITAANAVVTSRPGYLSLSDHIELANINPGDTISQPSTGANATVLLTPGYLVSTNLFYVNYTTAAGFNIGSGNITYTNSGNVLTVNSYPTLSNVALNTLNIRYLVNRHSPFGGNLFVNGADSAVTVVSVIKDTNSKTLTANVGDIITQIGTSGNAVVLSNVSDAATIPVLITNANFDDYNGNLVINGSDTNTWISNYAFTVTPVRISANVGDYITQSITGANAVVTQKVYGSQVIPVEFLANNFVTGSGNISLNSLNVPAFPEQVITSTLVSSNYNTSSTFDINFTQLTGRIFVNGTPTYANVTAVTEVGVDLTGTIDEGLIGFDEGRYDQGELVLPAGITINPQTGWITGRLPSQTVNQVEYQFEVIAYKRDEPNYRDTALFTITVLGDINNRIDWLTPAFLGSIQNGKVSDFHVKASHFTDKTPKTLLYRLKPSGKKKLPQGLSLLSTGLIVGRVSFQIYLLDRGETTIDGGRTTFDETYTFTVEALDVDRTISAERTFTMRVLGTNIVPYENLYLRALPSKEQRDIYYNLLQDSSIFPMDFIYRKEDAWFGLSKSIRTLFIPGLSPSTLAEYFQAAELNHFKKRLQFGEIKTARALDANFNTKYEVVYVEIKDENTNELGQGPSNVIDLSSEITNPYYDLQNQPFNIAYPNSFSNMQSRMVAEIEYANKGVLPDWMTSRQPNGRVLGYTRALVLAYCVPGSSDIVAYRLKESGFKFNELDFTVDRYLLDNVYSDNFLVELNRFDVSLETTFDRYPTIPSNYIDAGIVDYAVSDAFELINNQPYDVINAERNVGGLNGLDGVTGFRDGDLIVFAEQEFIFPGFDASYNSGWHNVNITWDETPWGFNEDTLDDDEFPNYDSPSTIDLTPSEAWNESEYVPGFIENNLNPAVTNQRIGVWRINILPSGIVRLTFVKAIEYFNRLYVRRGSRYGRSNIFFDPVIKPNKTVPNYTLFRQEIKTVATTFDGNGTRFYDNRDEYVVPEEGDKYIKFTKTGVFT